MDTNRNYTPENKPAAQAAGQILPDAIVHRLCIQTWWFGCTEMRRLTILTAWLVRTQETIQISLSEDTFMILTVFLIRTFEDHSNQSK